MQLVNFHYFYGVSKNLQELNHLAAEQPIISNWSALYNAEMAIRGFLENDVVPAEASRESGTALMDLLDSLTSNTSRPEPLSTYEVARIGNLLRTFENVLEGEYRIKIIFALSKKGLYSLSQLAYRGEEMVPASVHSLMPDIARDLRDAGRCVAFEVPTAAAFHLFRATEAAAKSYILAVRGVPVTDKEKNLGLGGYKKIIEGLGVDARITSALEQLVKLHRNPTIHPEYHVSNDEVLATLGMVESVIRVLAIDMQRRIDTPDIPLSVFIPQQADIDSSSPEISTPNLPQDHFTHTKRSKRRPAKLPNRK